MRARACLKMLIFVLRQKAFSVEIIEDLDGARAGAGGPLIGCSVLDVGCWMFPVPWAAVLRPQCTKFSRMRGQHHAESIAFTVFTAFEIFGHEKSSYDDCMISLALALRYYSHPHLQFLKTKYENCTIWISVAGWAPGRRADKCHHRGGF